MKIIERAGVRKKNYQKKFHSCKNFHLDENFCIGQTNGNAFVSRVGGLRLLLTANHVCNVSLKGAMSPGRKYFVYIRNFVTFTNEIINQIFQKTKFC